MLILLPTMSCEQVQVPLMHTTTTTITSINHGTSIISTAMELKVHCGTVHVIHRSGHAITDVDIMMLLFHVQVSTGMYNNNAQS